MDLFAGAETFWTYGTKHFFSLAQRVRRYPACLQDVRCQLEGMQREKANATSDFDAQMQVRLTEAWRFCSFHLFLPPPPPREELLTQSHSHA